MKKNKKGFTLIELLAVIVILAILVLIATPAITRIITSSQKNSLKNEVVEFSKNFDVAFTEKMNKTVKSTSGSIVELDKNVWNITYNEKNYAYLCMTLKDLVDDQYIKKNLGDSYGGYLQMWVPDGSGATITYVNITNGRYFAQGKMSQISNNNYSPSQSSIAKGSVEKPTKDTSCPKDASIPGDDVINNNDDGGKQEIPVNNSDNNN